MIHLLIRKERCKGCGLCIKFCKKNVLGLADTLNAQGYHPVETLDREQCSGCGDCRIICPDRAITVTRPKQVMLAAEKERKRVA